jgi:hypothetical protein
MKIINYKNILNETTDSGSSGQYSGSNLDNTVKRKMPVDKEEIHVLSQDEVLKNITTDYGTKPSVKQSKDK